MKAKVKATGEIIDFLGSSIEYGTCTWIDSKGNFRQGHDMPDIEILKTGKTIDWEQRRYEIAKEMFPYSIKQVVDILSDPNTSEEKFLKGNSKSEAAAKMAVGYANILIKELKK